LKLNKRKREKAGRPPISDEPMRRVNVMLDQPTIDKASEIGSGNLSAGLRIAVTKHRRRKPPTPETK
jgi:hypothetical protein